MISLLDLDQFRAAKSLAGVLRIGRALAQKLGFDSFLYGAHIPVSQARPHEVVIPAYPDGWMDCYQVAGYRRHDPVISHTLRSVRPAIWTEGFFGATRESLKLYHDAADFGLRTGITLPLRGANGEVVMFNLASSEKERHDKFFTAERVGAAQLLAASMHETLIDVHVRDNIDLPLPPHIALTPREKECLMWAAEGKTCWEISCILGIAERTVIFHVDNATAKLGASNQK